MMIIWIELTSSLILLVKVREHPLSNLISNLKTSCDVSSSVPIKSRDSSSSWISNSNRSNAWRNNEQKCAIEGTSHQLWMSELFVSVAPPSATECFSLLLLDLDIFPIVMMKCCFQYLQNNSTIIYACYTSGSTPLAGALTLYIRSIRHSLPSNDYFLIKWKISNRYVCYAVRWH